jgi:hypothetical protein
VEGLPADEDGEEWLGAAPAGRGGLRADGHLDEGVGASLGGASRQLGGRRFASESAFGLGPVGFEHLVFETGELL